MPSLLRSASGEIPLAGGEGGEGEAWGLGGMWRVVVELYTNAALDATMRMFLHYRRAVVTIMSTYHISV